MKPEEIETQMRELGFELYKSEFIDAYWRILDKEFAFSQKQATFLCQTIQDKVGEAEQRLGLVRGIEKVNGLKAVHEFASTLTTRARELEAKERTYEIVPGQATEILTQMIESFVYAFLKMAEHKRAAELDQAVQEAVNMHLDRLTGALPHYGLTEDAQNLVLTWISNTRWSLEAPKGDDQLKNGSQAK